MGCRMPSRGLFFDLDGTLIDTRESNALAYLRAIGEVLGSCDVDEAQLRCCIAEGKGCREFLRELIEGIEDEQIDAVASKKAQVYPEYLNESILNEELVRFMRDAKRGQGTVVVLVTTAKRKNALSALRHHGIEELFDHGVFGDDVSALKPDPEIYLKALEVSGVDPSHAEAFEDSEVGIRSATGAGIRAHRVDWMDA